MRGERLQLGRSNGRASVREPSWRQVRSPWRQITAIREKEAAARAVRDILLRKFFERPPAVTVHVRRRRWELNKSRADRAFNPVDDAIRCASVTNAFQQRPALMARGAVEPLNKFIRVWRPIVDAATNAPFLYWITDREIICVMRPSIFEESGRVHRRDGPAVVWASGERAWFWHGIEVARWIIERSHRIAATTSLTLRLDAA
jgi:hypothetical protein